MNNKLDLSKELIGRRALITGGTRGIDAAITQRLLGTGAKVVVAGDVTTSEGVEAIATKATKALGGLDILVNNVGGGSAFLGAQCFRKYPFS